MRAKTTLVLILAFTAGGLNAAPISLGTCQKIASEINKNYPMQVDKVTKAKSSICLNGNKKPQLVYLMEISEDLRGLHQNDLSQLRSQQIQAWCTDPKQFKLLRVVDIEYRYSYPSGKYIGATKISESNCR